MTAVVVGAANCKSSTSQIDFEVLFGSFLLVFETPLFIHILQHRFQVSSLSKSFSFLSWLVTRLASVGTLGIQ